MSLGIEPMSDRNQIENKSQQSAAPADANPQPDSTDATCHDAEARTDNGEPTAGGEPIEPTRSATAESESASAVQEALDPSVSIVSESESSAESESTTESESTSDSLPSLGNLERELGNLETLAREVSHQVGDALEPAENTTSKPDGKADHADAPPGVTALTPDAVHQGGDARTTSGTPPQPEAGAAFDDPVLSAATSAGAHPKVEKEQAAEHEVEDMLQAAASADTDDADATLPVPDFMKEFTEPASPTPAPETATTESAEPVPAQASDLIEPPPAAAVAPDLTAPQPTDPSAGFPTGMPQLAASTKPPDPTAGGDAANARTGRLQSIRAGLSARTLGLADKTADVLEALDRPFGKLGPRVRSIAGWFALSTLGTSLIVLLVSLF